jgi:hypothetical protein
MRMAPIRDLPAGDAVGAAVSDGDLVVLAGGRRSRSAAATTGSAAASATTAR